MTSGNLTRRQAEIYDYLLRELHNFPHPPSLDELCAALGLKSRGSLHKQLHALMDVGLVEQMNNQRRGIRLTSEALQQVIEDTDELPLYGAIAAGQPIEAITTPETIAVPPNLRTSKACYVLTVKGDSMINEGILDGDWVVIEQADHANNGDIVVALVEGEDATLKRIEQKQGSVVLHPANSEMEAMHFLPEQVQIQGVLVGQMRSYH